MSAMTIPLPERVPDHLPDFRNLGVALRILLSVNVAALLAAIVASPTPSGVWLLFRDADALIEPGLLATLGLLALLGPRLANLSYRDGAGIALGCVVAMPLAVQYWLRGLVTSTSYGYWRTALFALVMGYGLLGYF